MVDKIILTGNRPTGRLHVGHYVDSLRRRVVLQNSGEYKRAMIMTTGVQVLTDNFDNPEKVRQNIIEVTLDYLSVGLDPEKSVLFIQSQIPELTELTFFYSDLVTVAKLQCNPAVKNEIRLRNFKADIPVGFFTYPVSQAAGITTFKATTMPVGKNQLPMIEQTRETVRKFNSTYAPVLVESKVLIPGDAAPRRLPGTDGKVKMSKPFDNCIYLPDDADAAATRIKTMYTDPEHFHMNDPGYLEGNTTFTYLEAFSRPEHFEHYLPEYVSLGKLKAHCMHGGPGDAKVKKFLTAVMQEELEPIRKYREEYERDTPVVYKILKKGSGRAREITAETLYEVKGVMRIDYFEDSELTREQTRRYRKVAR